MSRWLSNSSLSSNLGQKVRNLVTIDQLILTYPRAEEDGADGDSERAVVSQSEILTYMFVGFLFVAIGE